jgi:hypothetical protein
MRSRIFRFGLVGIALCSVVVISFPSFSSPTGFTSRLQAVDRARKGDRVSVDPLLSQSHPKSQPVLIGEGKRVPVGCDRAFSSMSSPQFLGLYGRCAV